MVWPRPALRTVSSSLTRRVVAGTIAMQEPSMKWGDPVKVEHAIAAGLADAGVKSVFGLMGEEVVGVVGALEAHEIQYVSTRHDSAAVGMADGYSRTSGSLGVALVSRGPGLTNALTTIVTAARNGSSVVVLVGDAAAGLSGPSAVEASRMSPKHVDQAALLAATGVEYVALSSPLSAAADVAAITAHAARGTTVVVGLPSDVLEAESGGDPATIDLRQGPQLVEDPDLDAIRDVADLLGTDFVANKPVILAGRGAVRSGAGPALETLGDACGALLATTLRARGMFKERPFNLGVMGTFSSPVATELIVGADLILAFGASLNAFTTFLGTLISDAHVVQFDSDPSSFGKFVEPTLQVAGDARLSALALVEELARRAYSQTGYRSEGLARRIDGSPRWEPYKDLSEPGALDPRAVVETLDRVLPAERTLVVDGGNHFPFHGSYSRDIDPESWISPNDDFFAIGTGLGVAMGASIGRRDRPTVLATGDGAFMMNLGDLDTAVEHQIPLVIVVMNDSAFGAEYHFMELKGLSGRPALFHDREIAEVALSMGADGQTITRLEDLDALEARIDQLRGPLVLDVKINREIRSDVIDSWFALNR